jgi:hypothetical protein
MPYFIAKRKKQYCVVKGTKAAPGETMKCYPEKSKAQAYLAALYINVPDAKKDLNIFEVYKETYDDGTEDVDRWIAVSTMQKEDLGYQTVTTEAMDFDIKRALRTGMYPDLRMFHIRGFKLGKADSMDRNGIYAVDQGYWYKQPFPLAVKDLVDKDTEKKWRISRGFHPVKATGRCAECNSDLSVGLMNFIFGAVCKECGAYFQSPEMLKQLNYLATVTYDITITDIPALPETAVAAFTLSGLKKE